MGLRHLKVEMEALDPKIQEMWGQGLGCRKIGQALALDPAVVYRRLARFGKTRSQQAAHLIAVTRPKLAIPFDVGQTAGHWSSDMALGSFSIGDAIRWFLVHGYNVSLPVTSAPYDLIAESDNGLQRVQVKFTSVRNRDHSDSYVAAIHRWDYAADAQVNTRGKSRAVPYTKKDIDLFFIVTADEDFYIIPVEAVEGKCKICLGEGYKDYRVK